MVIAVAGGTGMAGREVVRALAARGHAVRVLSRSAPTALPDGIEHRRVDLVTGDGLAAALALTNPAAPRGQVTFEAWLRSGREVPA